MMMEASAERSLEITFRGIEIKLHDYLFDHRFTAGSKVWHCFLGLLSLWKSLYFLIVLCNIAYRELVSNLM